MDGNYKTRIYGNVLEEIKRCPNSIGIECYVGMYELFSSGNNLFFYDEKLASIIDNDKTDVYLMKYNFFPPVSKDLMKLSKFIDEYKEDFFRSYRKLLLVTDKKTICKLKLLYTEEK